MIVVGIKALQNKTNGIPASSLCSWMSFPVGVFTFEPVGFKLEVESAGSVPGVCGCLILYYCKVKVPDISDRMYGGRHI